MRPEAMRQALEDSLSDNPDDLATVMAYADLLVEQGDPRGEFIQVQLRLEDEALPQTERRKLAVREKQLLMAHEREWLGPLARYLLDKDASDISELYGGEDQTFAHRWRRGFLDRVEVHWFGARFAQSLVDSPAANWLRELVIHGELDDDSEVDPPDFRGKLPRGVPCARPFHDLIEARCLKTLRVLRLGDETGGEQGWSDCHFRAPDLDHLIRHLSRIEELVVLAKGYDARKLFSLKNLTHLRVLQVEHLDDYPLDVLARNAALGNLTHLWLHPHFHTDFWLENDQEVNGHLPLPMLQALVHSRHLNKLTHLRFRLSSAGDDGIRLLIDSGFLRQLKLLDLRHGCVTDAGARLLVDWPHLRQLELLDLSRNQLTAAGADLLRATGANVRCDDQHPVGSREYLTEGDFE